LIFQNQPPQFKGSPTEMVGIGAAECLGFPKNLITG
jgi:hypothetical protein